MIIAMTRVRIVACFEFVGGIDESGFGMIMRKPQAAVKMSQAARSKVASLSSRVRIRHRGKQDPGVDRE